MQTHLNVYLYDFEKLLDVLCFMQVSILRNKKLKNTPGHGIDYFEAKINVSIDSQIDHLFGLPIFLDQQLQCNFEIGKCITNHPDNFGYVTLLNQIVVLTEYTSTQ